MSDDRETHRPGGSRGQSHRARPAPNVKPKLAQSNSKENRWRREKPAKVRRSRSTDSNRAERGRRRERDGERAQRGRSEEARRRDRRDGEREAGGGAARGPPPGDDVEDTECAVCFCTYDNVFRTPKLLACGHTFCLECLARINVTSPDFKTLTCPVCRELTDLPHGRDLPRLGNNDEIIGKLPPDMHRALSIRFKRSKGKLLLKSPPPHSPVKASVFALPAKSPESAAAAAADIHLGTVEQGGVAPTTVVDVGRPPSRVRGRLRRLFTSDRCYYAVVGTIIAVAVALLLVGILTFVIIPKVAFNREPPPPGNQTTGPATAP